MAINAVVASAIKWPTDKDIKTRINCLYLSKNSICFYYFIFFFFHLIVWKNHFVNRKHMPPTSSNDHIWILDFGLGAGDGGGGGRNIILTECNSTSIVRTDFTIPWKAPQRELFANCTHSLAIHLLFLLQLAFGHDKYPKLIAKCQFLFHFRREFRCISRFGHFFFGSIECPTRFKIITIFTVAFYCSKWFNDAHIQIA